MKKNKRISSFSGLLIILLFAFIPTSASSQSHQDWSYNLGLYEVNVRQYTQAGTFNAFSTHLDRLDSLGVGILWFMPIHPIGEENRLGSLGSYYSVQNFLEVNPNFGTMEDFKELVQQAHDRDMYVIMDWVANHTSWDNVLTEEHPEWYVMDMGEFIPPPGTGWSDVIELDYTKQGLRDYMINAMKFWIDSTGVDGFRFDAVSFVPDDFWEEAITALKAHKPDILLLAENTGIKWHELGFDMTFSWDLYSFGGGILKNIADGTDNAGDMSRYMTNETSTYRDGEYRLYFTSTHDENSWEGTTSELFGNAAEVFAVLTGTVNGMPMIYSGQEAGLNQQLAFFDKDRIIWRDHENFGLYRTLLNLKKENKALWNGYNDNAYQRILTSNNSDIFAYLREKEEDRVFVVMNLSAQERNFTFTDSDFEGNYENVFTSDQVKLNDDTTFTLAAWDYRVFADDGTNTAIVGQEDLARSFRLHQNFPNPFNPSTVINYQLKGTGLVQLEVFDLTGRKITTLVNGRKQAGSHSVRFDAGDLSSGIYFYRLETESGKTLTRKMLLLK